MKKNLNFRYWTVMVLFFTVLITSGCEPFRKKFSRKKKPGSEDQVEVILDPQEYGDSVKTSLEIYTEHYRLWKMWISDLSSVIADRRGVVDDYYDEKKVSGTVERARQQLVAMQKLLLAEDQALMLPYIEQLDTISEEYDKPPAARNRTMVSSLVRNHERGIKDQFGPTKVKTKPKADAE